jgi:hypothetical protein
VSTSRLLFQICPHVAHRQYVDAEMSLLLVLMAADLQNGQAAGMSTCWTDGSFMWSVAFCSRTHESTSLRGGPLYRRAQ